MYLDEVRITRSCLDWLSVSLLIAAVGPGVRIAMDNFYEDFCALRSESDCVFSQLFLLDEPRISLIPRLFQSYASSSGPAFAPKSHWPP
jgi:hypothetical protein